MAPQIKDLLKDITESFRQVNNTSSQKTKNMEAVIKAAKEAAAKAESKKG